MNKNRIIFGLAFGDEGKGTTVHALVEKYGVEWVVRFTGAHQSAHNTKTSSGLSHTSRQFSSGVLREGVKTFYSKYCPFDPIALLREDELLIRMGVNDGLERFYVDENCLIVTPINAIINRIFELIKGDKTNGSTGNGVFETISDNKLFGLNSLIVKDLTSKFEIMKKLSFLKSKKLFLAEKLLGYNMGNLEIKKEVDSLRNLNLEELTNLYFEIGNNSLNIVSSKFGLDIIKKGNVVFEGAQGVLLDPKFGLIPHVTATDCTPKNALELIKDSNFEGEVEKIGVLRGYLTRHGHGPFPSQGELKIEEEHNKDSRWTGEFRQGWFDLILAQYALDVVGGVDYISLTNLDKLEKLDEFQVGFRYSINKKFKFSSLNFIRLKSLMDIKKINFSKDLKEEEILQITNILNNCSVTSSILFFKGEIQKFVKTLERRLNTKIKILSFGPTEKDKVFL